MLCTKALTTPVIHEYHAKDVFMGFLYGNSFSKVIPSSNKESLIRSKRSSIEHNSRQYRHTLLWIVYYPDWQKEKEDNSGLSLRQVISIYIQTLQTHRRKDWINSIITISSSMSSCLDAPNVGGFANRKKNENMVIINRRALCTYIVHIMDQNLISDIWNLESEI